MILYYLMPRAAYVGMPRPYIDVVSPCDVREPRGRIVGCASQVDASCAHGQGVVSAVTVNTLSVISKCFLCSARDSVVFWILNVSLIALCLLRLWRVLPCPQ